MREKRPETLLDEDNINFGLKISVSKTAKIKKLLIVLLYQFSRTVKSANVPASVILTLN